MPNYLISDRAATTAARDKQARELREKIENRLAQNREIVNRARIFGTLHTWENKQALLQMLHDESALRQLGDQPAPTRDEWRPSPSAVFETPQVTLNYRRVRLSDQEIADARARGLSRVEAAREKLDKGVTVRLSDEDLNDADSEW
jgi:hypothetical protein